MGCDESASSEKEKNMPNVSSTKETNLPIQPITFSNCIKNDIIKNQQTSAIESTNNSKTQCDEKNALKCKIQDIKYRPQQSPLSSSNSSKAEYRSFIEKAPTPIVVPNTDQTVRLNVYGLTTLNQVIRCTGLGIYHSGVEVYGAEWAYGGYPYPVSSIFRMRKPRDLASLSDIHGKFHFVEALEMGITQFTYEEIRTIISNLGKGEWIGTNYHLLYKNCNNFSNELCKILCNKPIPSWVNRVASITSKFPYLIRMLPQEYFTPVALQDKLQREQALKYRLSKSISQEAHEGKCFIINAFTSCGNHSKGGGGEGGGGSNHLSPRKFSSSCNDDVKQQQQQVKRVKSQNKSIDLMQKHCKSAETKKTNLFVKKDTMLNCKANNSTSLESSSKEIDFNSNDENFKSSIDSQESTDTVTSKDSDSDG